MTDDMANILASMGTLTGAMEQELQEMRRLIAEGKTLMEPTVPPVVGDWPKPKFGGKFAPWAIPSKYLNKHPNNNTLVHKYLTMTNGEINCDGWKWSIALQYYDETVNWAKLNIINDSWSNLDEDRQKVPWDPSWKLPDDDDRYNSIINRSNGMCYLVWQPRYIHASNTLTCGAVNIVKTTANPDAGTVGDIYTKENGFQPSRAAGLAQPHGLVDLGDLAWMEINHALALGLPQPYWGDTTGPWRSRFMAPATKPIGRTGSDESSRLLIGARIVYDLSDQRIESWVDGLREGFRPYAFAIAEAIRSYGMILVDNAGDRNRKRGKVYFESNITAEWEKNIGITEQDLQFCLHGLLPNAPFWIAEEPTFPGNDINRVAVYPNVIYPEGYR